MAFEFIDDVTTHTIDEQFMWGSGLMFSPVLEPSVSAVDSYFPRARWYEIQLLVRNEVFKTKSFAKLH